MITITELKRWLATLSEADSVGVDADGLTLISHEQPDARLEVGGLPEESEKG